MACPICKTELPPPAKGVKDAKEARYRPFCSSRCQLIDLGNWLGEKYAVPGDEAPPSETGNPPTTAISDEEKRSPTLH